MLAFTRMALILTAMCLASAVYAQGRGQFNIGLLGFYQSEQYRGQGGELIPYPWLGLKIGSFEFDRNELSYRLIETNSFEFGFIGFYEFDGYEAEESPFLEGMKDRKSGLQFGVEAEFEASFLEFDLSLTRDVLGVHSGYIAEFGVGFDTPITDKFILGLSIGVEVYDETFSNYYFGVKENEATALRPQYKPGATINPVLEAQFQYQMNDDYSIAARFEHVMMDQKLRDSPIVERSSFNQVFFGITYTGFFGF